MHVHSDQPVGGTSIFGIRDQDNQVITDVGVAAAEPGEEFTIFADTIGDSNTGVGVVNPDANQTLSLDFELYDPTGTLVATETRLLGPRGHFARFLPEIFSGVARITEFEGSVVIRSVAGSPRVAKESTGHPLLTPAKPSRTLSVRVRSSNPASKWTFSGRPSRNIKSVAKLEESDRRATFRITMDDLPIWTQINEFRCKISSEFVRFTATDGRRTLRGRLLVNFYAKRGESGCPALDIASLSPPQNPILPAS